MTLVRPLNFPDNVTFPEGGVLAGLPNPYISGSGEEPNPITGRGISYLRILVGKYQHGHQPLRPLPTGGKTVSLRLGHRWRHIYPKGGSPRGGEEPTVCPRWHSLADINHFPQEAPEASSLQSKVLSAPSQEVVIPLRQDVRDIVEAAHCHWAQKTSLLPLAIHTGYRIPKQDWALLGVVWPPEEILKDNSKTKKSSKGINQLQNQLAAALASAHIKTAKAMAHSIFISDFIGLPVSSHGS
jgi:hypothetical protein